MNEKEFSEKMEQRLEILKNILEIYKKIEKSKDNNEEDDELENNEPKETREEFAERWKKEDFVKEYFNFTEWCFGDLRQNGFESIEKIILTFSKRHPDLPLLKYVDQKGFNHLENIILILMQAHKHYLNRKG